MEQPRIAMSEAASRSWEQRRGKYLQALNRSLEQMWGRLTKSELTDSKSADALIQAIDKRNHSFRSSPFSSIKRQPQEALTQALARLWEDDTAH